MYQKHGRHCQKNEIGLSGLFKNNLVIDSIYLRLSSSPGTPDPTKTRPRLIFHTLIAHFRLPYRRHNGIRLMELNLQEKDMACFVTPLATAIIATVARKRIPTRLHPGWLLTMLWGAVVALIVDHAINGEISIYPPFLTALENPAETAVMLKEIAVTGTAMTAAIFATWGIMLLVSWLRSVRAAKHAPTHS